MVECHDEARIYPLVSRSIRDQRRYRDRLLDYASKAVCAGSRIVIFNYSFIISVFVLYRETKDSMNEIILLKKIFIIIVSVEPDQYF